MEGRIDEWLEMREWSASELNCKLRPESNVAVAVSFRASDGQQFNWVAAFNRTELQCSTRNGYRAGRGLASCKGAALSDRWRKGCAAYVQVSGLDSVATARRGIARAVLEFRDCMRKIRSLSCLRPT